MNNKSMLAKLLAMMFAMALLATACGGSSDGGEDASTGNDDAASQTDDGDDDGDSEPADDGGDSEPADDGDSEDVDLVQADDLLDAIQARGELNCGVSTVSIGFAEADSNGV